MKNSISTGVRRLSITILLIIALILLAFALAGGVPLFGIHLAPPGLFLLAMSLVMLAFETGKGDEVR